METKGRCDERFAAVQSRFEANFDEFGEVGASYAVTLDGEVVVDIWRGHRDAACTKPWEEDTIVPVYSTSKTLTFICALLLVQRGQLDINAPVRDYWPEFRGSDVLVWHALSHSAGLPGFAEPFPPNGLLDWDLSCRNLAAQTPSWEPGTQSGYHGITQGYLIGEVVRRITGRTIGTYLREEVGVDSKTGADFHIGVDPKDFDRIAELVPPTEPFPWLADPATTNEAIEALAPKPDPATAMEETRRSLLETRTAEWRQAEIPAANGHGNARSIVKAQTALANGGAAFGTRLFDEDTCRLASETLVEGVDRVLGVPLRFGFGYALPNETFTLSPNLNTMAWGGLGGSLAVVDPQARLCCGYAMNQMGNQIMFDERAGALITETYRCLAAD